MKFPSSTPLAAFASLVLLCCNFAAAQNIDHEVAVKQPVDAKVAGLMLYYTRKRSYDTMFFVVNEYATAGDDEEIIAQYLCIYTHGHMRFMREYAEGECNELEADIIEGELKPEDFLELEQSYTNKETDKKLTYRLDEFDQWAAFRTRFRFSTSDEWSSPVLAERDDWRLVKKYTDYHILLDVPEERKVIKNLTI